MRSLLLALLLLLNPSAIFAQRSLRVLVDASKDGGLWWFPQAHNFDANEHHQGRPLAEFMRKKGWTVVELGRGDVITFDKLRDFDIVIRPPVYFDYTNEELVAYRDRVLGGMRLLLMGGGNGDKDDSLATLFGLRFDSRSRFGAVQQWIPHPFSANIAGKDLSWSNVSESPPEAVLLAWLNQGEANPRPVLGYLPYGSGYVVFVGQGFISPDLFSSSLISALGRFNRGELTKLAALPPKVAAPSVGVGPTLLEPIADATLPQPESGAWRFDWDDVPGAQAYEIVVLGASAAFPIVQTTTTTSEYVFDRRSGYIIDSNLLGWSWRVRAQHLNGTWGPWSRIRRFNVMPMTRRSN